MQEFQVSKYLSLRLEDECTIIYIAGKRFRQCKYLLLNIPVDEMYFLEDLESIDEAAEILDKSQEGVGPKEIKIPPEVEYWGHCSNLQVWYENEYDTRLLHSNLAFPLLKRLTETGDPLALEVFKAEIIKRYRDGTETTRKFLVIENFLAYLPTDERLNLLLNTDDFNTLMELSEEIDIDSPLLTLEALFNRIKIDKKEIVELDLGKFGLREFPMSILNFKSLKVLSLKSNFLKEIPRRINRLKSLHKLWLNYNKLCFLPSSICSLISLEQLWLDNNKIRWLPKHVGKLIRLRSLHLSFNRLKNLPESLCDLKSLKKIFLLSNYLGTLPKCLYKLRSIECIDLRGNSFIEYPNILKEMKNNKMIKIEL
jgi:Leucine-rich repeat (LRR) protein